MAKEYYNSKKTQSIRWLLLCLILSLFSQIVNAQSINTVVKPKKRPRVGVVLSGGGAKGFAHIGALKVIEEAGVPIDYIAGTSMGSIVGGLYAVGYDPDSMTTLVKRQDWNSIMADVIPRKYIPIDERLGERNYLATFPFLNKKINIKSSVFEGEMIEILLARLMSPAYRVKDYSKLSVPYLCVATNMENAEAVEMNSGILHRSIRASMSIPFYFKPTIIDDKVLVDGGIRNNFPVINVKDKGVDIIIGVDVQRDFYPKEKLNSSKAILEQMITMTGMEEAAKARANTDIYIRPNLKGAGMLDFNSFDSIIYAGEVAAREKFQELKHLADSLYAIEPYEIKRPHIMPLDSIYIVGIVVDEDEAKNINFFKKAFDKSFPNIISIDDIEAGIYKIYASGYYSSVWYELMPAPTGAMLNIHCVKKEESSAAIAAHFDSDYGIGVLINLSLKNLISINERSNVELDVNVAENPYLKLRHYAAKTQRFKYGSEITSMYLSLDQYDDGIVINSYNIQDNRLDLFAQLSPTLKQHFRIGFIGEYINLKDNLGYQTSKNEYDFYTFLYVHYFFNNENSSSFVSKGWKMNVLGKYVIPIVHNEDGSIPDNSFMVQADIEGAIAIGKRNSFKIGAVGAMKLGVNDMPVNYKCFVGGQSNMRYFDNIYSFTGLKFIQLFGDHVAYAKTAWQCNYYKNFYAALNCDFGYVTDGYDDWFNTENFVIGYGLTLGVKTLGGPIEVSIMGSNLNSDPVGFINVGYWF